MKRLIEFPLEAGGSIIIEVNEMEEGIVHAARPGEIAAKASQTFEAALERIKPAAGAIIARLRDLSDPPNEAQIEFEIKLSAEAGAFIASASTEANFKVTLIWKHEGQREI